MKNHITKHGLGTLAAGLLLLGTAVGTCAATNSVTFGSNFFNPKDITIHEGDTVIWTDSGGTHTVTGDGSNNPNNDVFCGNTFFSAGGKCTNTFNTPGFYRYRCTLHSSSFTSGMVGTVTVLSAAAPPPVLTNTMIFSAGRLQFTVNSAPNTTNIVEASTNFLSWEPLQTNVPASGTFTITNDTALIMQFYRVHRPQ